MIAQTASTAAAVAAASSKDSAQMRLLGAVTNNSTNLLPSSSSSSSTTHNYRAALNQRSSMFVTGSKQLYTPPLISHKTSSHDFTDQSATRPTRSPMMMIGGGSGQPRLSSNTSHLSLSSSGGVRLKTGTAAAGHHGKRDVPSRSRFDDPLYRAKQLKKQRKQDIQKRFTDTTHPNVHKSKSKSKTGRAAASGDTEYQAAQCHFTFIFDPNGRLSYWMGFIVSLAFLYNFWVMIYRYSFNEINTRNKYYWFSFDYFADFLYICDILFNFRTGFLEEGVLQTDPLRLRHYYMNTTRFYIDCLCLIPLDILYLSIGYNSILRCFRLVKIYRFWEFLDRTERHTNFPNFFRTIVMLHYLFAIFHWNACFTYFLSRYLSDDFIFMKPASSSSSSSAINYAASYISATTSPPPPPPPPPPLPHQAISSSSSASLPFTSSPIHASLHSMFAAFGPSSNNEFVHTFPSSRGGGGGGGVGTGSEPRIVPMPKSAKFQVDLLREYLKAFYTSTKVMTLVSDLPSPRTSRDYLFAIVQLVFALLLFATIMGHVGYIVSNLGNARKDFQSKLDGVKTYMSLRCVPKRLQDRVIRWFDFLWSHHKSIDDNEILGLLPYKLRAEIAIHVHLDTLKRVEIFQNTEAGFLNELVLRLKPVLYSPGDFICRKGEVGKEMYIVSAGKLQVISDDGKSVLATLKAGSYFGEISILNMGASGNRRTASVKSVGYSDLFCLSKEDLWEVLKEYPAVRVKLEAIAVRRLEKHKLPLSEIVNMKRCKSSPGLLQISLASPPVNKNLRRYGTLPATLLKRTDMSLVVPSPYAASTTNVRRRNKTSTPVVAIREVTLNKSGDTASLTTAVAAAAAAPPKASLDPSSAIVTTVNESMMRSVMVVDDDEVMGGVTTTDETDGSMRHQHLSDTGQQMGVGMRAGGGGGGRVNRLSISSINSSSTSTTTTTHHHHQIMTTNTKPSMSSSHKTNSPPSSSLSQTLGGGGLGGLGGGDQLSDDVSSTMSRMRESSLACATHVHMSGALMPPSYNERVLMGEVEKLKKFVYYLKAENLTLNFKLNKYRHHVGHLDLEVDCSAKAKPESSDIDDFRV